MSKKIALLTILITSAIFFGLYYSKKSPIKELRIGDMVLNVEVADTDPKRIQGLSGRAELGEGEAMLFVFESDGFYGIWMKDMNFPIDIAWLNQAKEIVHIEKSVSPETYPKVFTPSSPSRYVLETKAGFFENGQIKIGTQVEF